MSCQIGNAHHIELSGICFTRHWRYGVKGARSVPVEVASINALCLSVALLAPSQELKCHRDSLNDHSNGIVQTRSVLDGIGRVRFLSCSWNYPFHNFMNHIFLGFFTGNAVVGKVSKHASWSLAYFGPIVKLVCTAHGHDLELVQCITRFGKALTSHHKQNHFPLVASVIS